MKKITDPHLSTAATGWRSGRNRSKRCLGPIVAMAIIGAFGSLSGCKPFVPDERGPILVADPSVVDVPEPQPQRSVRRSPPIVEPPMPPGLPELRAPALAATPLVGAHSGDYRSPEVPVSHSPGIEEAVSPQEAEPATGMRDIVGYSEEEVAGLLGAPNHVHEEPPATIWQYSKDGCQLDIYLYMDMSTESFRVLTYELLNTAGAASGDDRCRESFPSLAGSG